MDSKIGFSEIEKLIQKNIKDRGISGDITLAKIEDIKNKVREQLSKNEINKPILNNIDEVETAQNKEDVSMPVQTSVANPENITQETIVDEKSMELSKKEGQIQGKESELLKKEEELNRREAELNAKEQELKYKPVVPTFLEQAEPDKIFIFDMNELNFGGETLTTTPYHLVDSPEKKTTMHDLWLEKGKVRAEVFKVQLEKIGEMVFNPMEGICKFEQKTSSLESNNLDIESKDSVLDAINSQIPKEPLIDTIEPIKDVVLPMTGNMGLATPDTEALILRIAKDALRKYLEDENSVPKI